MVATRDQPKWRMKLMRAGLVTVPDAATRPNRGYDFLSDSEGDPEEYET